MILPPPCNSPKTQLLSSFFLIFVFRSCLNVTNQFAGYSNGIVSYLLRKKGATLSVLSILFHAVFSFCLLAGQGLAADERLNQSINLRSASELDYPPLAIVNEDGTADGFSVDLLKAVCKTVGLKLSIKVGPWDTIKQELAEGELDVLPLVSYSKERDTYFDFSLSYIKLHGTVFLRKDDKRIQDINDLVDKEVMVMRGDTAHEYAVKNKISSRLVLTESIEEAFGKLAKGEHDAVLVKSLVGWQLIRNLGLTNLTALRSEKETDLKPFGEKISGFEQKFCFAVREGNQELLMQLNEGLALVIANGTYTSLYEKWLCPTLSCSQSHLPFKQYYQYLLTVLLPLAFVISCAGLLLLRKEVRRKTSILEMEIAERKQIEHSLRKSEQEIRLLLDSTAEGIFGLDLDGICTFCNKSCLDILGYEKASDLVGKNVHELTHHSHKDGSPYLIGECKINKGFKSGRGTHVDDEVFWRVDGSCFDVEYWSYPLNVGSELSGGVVTFMDITARKRAEVELKQARSMAERANQAKSTFLANMSHEIRTPMNSIIGFTDLLLIDEKDSDRHRQLGLVSRSAHNLLELLNDILDFSKIEANRLEIHEGEFSVHRLLANLDQTFRQQAAEKGLVFTVKIHSSLPESVKGDEHRLNQILLNLLSNAFKFTERGAITLDCFYQAGTATFTLCDTGIGLPPEKRELIFKPFMQVESNSARSHGGTGLGLAISKQLVELLSGSLTVKSQVGLGSTFVFTLPLLAVGDGAVASVQKVKRLSGGGEAMVKKWLAVDSDLWLPGVVKFCLANLPKKLQHLENAIANNQAWDIEFISNDIKRSTGPLGMKEICQLAKKINEMVRNEEFDRDRVNNLYKSLTGIVASIPTSYFEKKDYEALRHIGMLTDFKILVADDIEMNQVLVRNVLRNINMDADMAVNGKETLAMLAVKEYDLLLLDMHMPVMDGLETISRIRSDPHLSSLWVIALTADAMKGDAEIFLKAGCDDYLAKPMDMDQLYERINSLVMNKKERINVLVSPKQ